MEYLITIYVLELENNKYYVGKSKNFKKRLNEHNFGKGSSWTSQNRVLKVLKTFQYTVKSVMEEVEKENLITLQIMIDKGWKNVRGGWWCNTGELNTIKGLQHHGYFLNVEIDKIDYKAREYCIYVLELENNKYYVGYTYQLSNALKNHENGKASKWTKMYKPKQLIYHKSIKCNSDELSIDLVDEIVLKYFELKGIENVRGGSFLIIDELKHLQSVKRRK